MNPQFIVLYTAGSWREPEKKTFPIPTREPIFFGLLSYRILLVFGDLRFDFDPNFCHDSSNFYFPQFPSVNTGIRRMRWAGHVARMGEKRNAYRIVVGKPEGKRPRRGWVDNITIDLR
jgi:hypothetical protein